MIKIVLWCCSAYAVTRPDVAGDTSFAKKPAKAAPLLFWVARRAKTKTKAPALLWWLGVLLFLCFPASAPVWVWGYWWLMWVYWYFVLYWYWYSLSL